jgi:hypothetical protein
MDARVDARFKLISSHDLTSNPSWVRAPDHTSRLALEFI